MTALVDGVRACWLAVAVCVGGVGPVGAPPRIEVVANEPHLSPWKGPGLYDGFACGTYEDGSTAYCAGLSEGRWIVVSTATFAALTHEMIHHVVKRRHLGVSPIADTWDGAHEGPWWHCERADAIPECAGFFPARR